jgi:hypothetical protein
MSLLCTCSHAHVLTCSRPPQALLAEWRRELARKPLAMSEGEALQVLGMTPGPDGVVSEDELRRAYRCGAACCAACLLLA